MRIPLCAVLAVASVCGQSASSPRVRPVTGPRSSISVPHPPAGRWFAGDLHVHDDHSSDGSTPRQRNKDRAKGNVAVADQIGQATKNGLDFLPLTDHRTYVQHYDPQWESSSLLLIPGEEANGSPHATVLGGVDSVVQGAIRAGQPASARLQQSIWNAHSQGAVWSVAHPDDGELNKDGTPNVLASVQGVDLVEIWNRARNVEAQIDYAENRWNAGFRFGVAAASDGHSRERWDQAGPGMPTSAVFAAELNARAIIEGLRSGRTGLSSRNTTGPRVMLSTDIQGRDYTPMGGDEVIVPSGTSGHLRIQVQRAAGMQVLLYRRPGRKVGPLKTFEPAKDDETYTVDIVATDQPDWYRVEVRTSNPSEVALKLAMQATTSPIFVSPAPVNAVPEVPVPADQGQDDDAVWAAGAKGAFAGFPDVAVESGTVHLLAESHGESTSTVIYRRRNAKGVWNDAERTISGKGLARFPRIAVRGHDVWVAWQEESVYVPHRPVIHLRHSSDNGSTWESTRILRSVEGRAEHPGIAITASGKPFLVWQEIRSGQPFDVMAQEVGLDKEPRNLSRGGKSIDPGTSDDSRSPRYPASVWPAVAAAPDGRIAVAWQDNRTDPDPLWTGTAVGGKGTNPDDWQILVAARDIHGNWTVPVSLGAPDRADMHPDLAFHQSGTLVAAWESKVLEPAGVNVSIMTAVSADGLTFSRPAVLAPLSEAMMQRPRLGQEPDGAIRAVWYDSRSADWRWRVMTALHGIDSGWNEGIVLSGRGNNTWPATAGGVIVFAGTRNAIRLQRDPTQQVFVLPSAKKVRREQSGRASRN